MIFSQTVTGKYQVVNQEVLHQQSEVKLSDSDTLIKYNQQGYQMLLI